MCLPLLLCHRQFLGPSNFLCAIPTLINVMQFRDGYHEAEAIATKCHAIPESREVLYERRIGVSTERTALTQTMLSLKSRVLNREVPLL